MSDSLHGSDNEDEHETDAHDGEADSSGEAGDEEINDSVFEDGIRHYPFNAGTSARRERLNAESSTLFCKTMYLLLVFDVFVI